MPVTDFFAGEIATELLKCLLSISSKQIQFKSIADQLILDLNELLPIIQEIKYSGVELPQWRQAALDRFSETLRNGIELAQKVRDSKKWNLYRKMLLARKMEKLEQSVAKFLRGPLQAYILADVHHARFENTERFDRTDASIRRVEKLTTDRFDRFEKWTTERFDRTDASTRRLEKLMGELKVDCAHGHGEELLGESMKRMESEEEEEGNSVKFGSGMVVGKKRVKEMIIGRDDTSVVGITGMGGSGKTTLAKDVCRDDEVKSHFSSNILFLTVSQSPNVDQLKKMISVFRSKCRTDRSGVVRMLIVLDDVWTLLVLKQLVFNVPGCKTLVVSRDKFREVVNLTYEMELLREDEATSLLCQSAFGQKSIPPAANENLVRQVVNECKGLPLALKVIGASLRNQPQVIWASVSSKLSRGLALGESHEINLLDQMAFSINYLSNETVKECFLDFGAFPEDQKIPVSVLISMWVEIHDIEELDAFTILVELSEKNLITLVKNERDGDLYSSSYDISVTQHDLLRDLALHLSNGGKIKERRRSFMARREKELPKEWRRYANEPFNALVVSIHTGEMKGTDWYDMKFPEAEVLIINFSSSEYFLPPFIKNMPKLRALIVVNHGTAIATLDNVSIFKSLANLRSLWFEKISIPPLYSITLNNLQKISMVLCRVGNYFDTSTIDLSCVFPILSELMIDHCDDLMELPSSISKLQYLKRLSITNCPGIHQLPDDLGKLECIEVLRFYACPYLKRLPSSISELVCLKYLDISQCVNVECLPDGIGGLMMLEKIDMRECLCIENLPHSVASLQALRHVVCDEDISSLWKAKIPGLHVQVAKGDFRLDWLAE